MMSHCLDSKEVQCATRRMQWDWQPVETNLANLASVVSSKSVNAKDISTRGGVVNAKPKYPLDASSGYNNHMQQSMYLCDRTMPNICL